MWTYPDVCAYKYKYYSQKVVSDHIYSAVLEGNSIAMAVGLHWAEYSLGFSFHPAEIGRGNKYEKERIRE